MLTVANPMYEYLGIFNLFVAKKLSLQFQIVLLNDASNYNNQLYLALFGRTQQI